jgi:hypothetical protein
MPTTTNAEGRGERARRFTQREILEDIEKQIERNVAYYGSQTEEVIAQRIEELKQEWSIDRLLQAKVATAGLVGGVLGLAGRRKWGLLVAAAFGFLLYNGLRGPDAAVPFLRRLGIRTRSEIDREICALKVARGDFKNVSAERAELKAIPAKEIIQAVSA